MELPDYLDAENRVRLFPVLSDTSKEGRTTSIMLACLANVRELSFDLFGAIGQRVGKTTKVDAFTEVRFPGEDGAGDLRPDGVITLTTGKRRWTALVEAKVGAAELQRDQVESYLGLARRHDIDAVITISNQFTTTPAHHPLDLPQKLTKRVGLFHWSWMYIRTAADLLCMNDAVDDRDQRYVVDEMVRFLSHDSAGVKGFASMPSEWADLVKSAAVDAALAPRSDMVLAVVDAWHQELRDLSLIMSRVVEVSQTVEVKLPRAHASDQAARIKSDSEALAKRHVLEAALAVPGAAAPIGICANIKSRTIACSLRLRAPDDRKSTRARVNWLLRQLPRDQLGDDLLLRLFWPGRAESTQYPIVALIENPDLAPKDRESMQVTSFEILQVRQLAGRFGQRRNFIADLEAAVAEFYGAVVARVKRYQPAAPRMRDATPEPSEESAAGVEGAG